MSPDIERLIRLQDIESRASDASRRVADAPGRIEALDARLEVARAAVAAARQALADNHTSRRSIEKDIAAAQQRVSKYKDQLMEVKTNDEYHAMQHQIASAASELERVEEQMLLAMLAADDFTAAATAADRALAAEEAAVAAERRAIEEEAARMRAEVGQCATERTALVAQMDSRLVELFDRLATARQGLAVAAAAAERCTVCHVRLRPQAFNQLRLNESIIQCESCQRILYYAPAASHAGQPGENPQAAHNP